MKLIHATRSMASLLLSVALTMMLITTNHNSHAYDGDVDFSAPYLTVDPETGKLVTVDPKEQPVATPHQNDQTDTPKTSSTVTVPADTQMSRETPGTQAVSNTKFFIGLVIGLAVAGIVVAATRKQPPPG